MSLAECAAAVVWWGEERSVSWVEKVLANGDVG